MKSFNWSFNYRAYEVISTLCTSFLHRKTVCSKCFNIVTGENGPKQFRWRNLFSEFDTSLSLELKKQKQSGLVAQASVGAEIRLNLVI